MRKNNISLDLESLQKRVAALEEVLHQVKQAFTSLEGSRERLKKQKKKASDLRQALSALPAFSLAPKKLVENLKKNLKIETETRLISIEKNFAVIKERLIVNFKLDLGKELMQFGSSMEIQEKVQHIEWKFQNTCSKKLAGCKDRISKQFDATLISCDYILQDAELPDGQPYLKALKIAEEYLNTQKRVEALNQILSDPSNLWIDDEEQNWLTEDVLVEAEAVLLRAEAALNALKEHTEFLEKSHRKATDLQQALSALPTSSLEPKKLVENLRENWKTKIETQLISIEKNFEAIKEELIVNFKFDLGKELLPFSVSTGIQEPLQKLEWKFQNACGRELEGCKDAIRQQFEATLLSCDHILHTAKPPDGQLYLETLKIAKEYLNISKESVNSQRQGDPNLHSELVQQISDIKHAVDLFKKDNEYREAVKRQKVQISSNKDKEKLLKLFATNGQEPLTRLGFDEAVKPTEAVVRAWKWYDDWENHPQKNTGRLADIYRHAVFRLEELLEVLEEEDNYD